MGGHHLLQPGGIVDVDEDDGDGDDDDNDDDDEEEEQNGDDDGMIPTTTAIPVLGNHQIDGPPLAFIFNLRQKMLSSVLAKTIKG